MPRRNKPTGSTQEERDRIALGVIENYMDAVATGTLMCPSCKKETKFKEITPAQATLLRARYDKLRPSLSTIEQTLVDQRDKLSEDQIVAQMSALFSAKPELLEKVLLIVDPPALATAHEAPAAQQ